MDFMDLDVKYQVDITNSNILVAPASQSFLVLKLDVLVQKPNLNATMELISLVSAETNSKFPSLTYSS